MGSETAPGLTTSQMINIEDAMKKILVIDDNPVVRQTLARVLEDEDYEIVTAPDDRCGISLYETEQPDLVITASSCPRRRVLRQSARCCATTPTPR